MRKRLFLGTLAGASIIALGGATAALAAGGDPGRVTVTAASPSSSPAVDPGRARQIAQDRVPGATVTETDLDHEHGQLVWEIELTKQQRAYEVDIDAATGAVVRVDQDNEDADADSEHIDDVQQARSPGAVSTVPKLSADRARQIAQDRVPGATVTETDLDQEHEQLVWEIELTKQQREYEVAIDAATGAVVKVDQDHGNAEHDHD